MKGETKNILLRNDLFFKNPSHTNKHKKLRKNIQNMNKQINIRVLRKEPFLGRLYFFFTNIS